MQVDSHLDTAHCHQDILAESLRSTQARVHPFHVNSMVGVQGESYLPSCVVAGEINFRPFVLQDNDFLVPNPNSETLKASMSSGSGTARAATTAGVPRCDTGTLLVLRYSTSPLRSDNDEPMRSRSLRLEPLRGMSRTRSRYVLSSCYDSACEV